MVVWKLCRTHHKMNYDENKSMQYQSDIINNIEKEGKSRGFFGYDYRDLQMILTGIRMKNRPSRWR